MIAVLRLAPAADSQLAIQLLVELLLLTLPCRNVLALGDLGSVRLPMADWSEPRQMRGRR